MKKIRKKKNPFIIVGIVVASLALVFGILAVINQIGEMQMNKYIDTFSAVEVEDALIPVLEDGEYYFTTDREFKVMQLTDVHLGGGFLSRNEDRMTINAIAAMVAAEKPDLIIVTGDVSFAVPYISGTINNAIPHRMFMRLMEKLGISWTVVFGNHDSEAYDYYNRAAVSKMYADESLESCLFIPDGFNINGICCNKVFDFRYVKWCKSYTRRNQDTLGGFSGCKLVYFILLHREIIDTLFFFKFAENNI